MPEGYRIGIVAALEREVGPFIKGWPTVRREYAGRLFKFFEKDGVVVVCGGMGSEAARRAAEAVVSLYQPALLISAGFAGALEPGLSAGHTLTPRQVIDAGDGSRRVCEGGDGVLVTFASVADVEQKARLAKAYGAHAVDMEAAAVATAAEAHGVPFLACKVISDPAESSLPPLARFIDNEGRFHAVKFLGFIAVRPWLWGKIQGLARDSAIAAEKLCAALQQTVASDFEAQVSGQKA